MAGIMSLFQKLGFTSGMEDEMDTGKRYASDAEEEEDEDDEEDEEESRGGFFPFDFPIFGRRKNRDDSEEDEEDEVDEEEEEDSAAAQESSQGRSGKVINYKKNKERKSEASSGAKDEKHCEHIVVVRQLADSRTIITHLHNGDSVILNLENIDPKDCGRVIDLLSGAAFALGGSIVKVSRLTYLLAPDTVKVVPPQSTPTASRYSL